MPSPVKSPTATETCREPGRRSGSRSRAASVPSPLPSRTTASCRSPFAVTTSSLPSPLRSPSSDAMRADVDRVGGQGGREAAVAVAQQHLDVPPWPSSTSIIDVEVTTRSMLPSALKSPAATGDGRTDADVDVERGLEGAIAVAQQDARRRPADRDARSRLPSLLKSATASERGPMPAPEVRGGAEAAVAVAEQHADGAVVVVRRGQVEMAVVVEVGRHHRLGVRADGETRGRAEAEQAAVFQGFEPAKRRGSQRAAARDWRWPSARLEASDAIRASNCERNDMVRLPSQVGLR